MDKPLSVETASCASSRAQCKFRASPTAECAGGADFNEIFIADAWLGSAARRLFAVEAFNELHADFEDAFLSFVDFALPPHVQERMTAPLMATTAVACALGGLALSPPSFINTAGHMLVLSNVGTTTDTAISAVAAMSMLLGYWAVSRRHENSPAAEQLVNRLGGAVLAASGGLHAAIFALDTLAPGLVLVGSMAYPVVAVRHLLDVLALPLWVTAAGLAAGHTPSDVIPTACFAGFGAAGLAGADAQVSSSMQWGYLTFGMVCAGTAAVQVSQGIPKRARVLLPAESAGALQFCCNILGLYLITDSVVQCLGVAHAVGGSQMWFEYGVLDLLLKLGGCHLLTKYRWERVAIGPIPLVVRTSPRSGRQTEPQLRLLERALAQ